MMCWKVYRSERNLLSVISRAIFTYNRLTVLYLHTSLSHAANNENAKLDTFVDKLRLRNSRSTKVHGVTQKSVRSEKFAKVKAQSSVNRYVVVQTNFFRTQSVEEGTQTSMQNYSLSNTESMTKVSTQKRQQRILMKDKDLEKKTVVVVKDALDSKSRLDNIGLNDQRVRMKDFSERNDSKEKISVCVDSDKVFGYSTENSRVASPSTYPPHVLYPEKNPNTIVGWLTKSEEASLKQLLDCGRAVEALSEIEAYARQNQHVSFGFLRYFSDLASTQGLVNEIMRIKIIAKRSHPKIYKKNLCLDNFVASALCYNGDFSGSIEKLSSLYEKYPDRFKKVSYSWTSIMYNIMKTNESENEQMVVKFVTDIADKQNILSPALDLWHIGFCSTLYRQQKIAESLVESYPGLIDIMPQKLDNLILLSDIDLLHRIFELLLRHQFSGHYAAATSALLQYQCDIGDLAGANQTLKFALTLKVQLKPSEIQRLLVVLYHQSLPAPPLLLQMKYQIPSKPKPHRQPEFPYKF